MEASLPAYRLSKTALNAVTRMFAACCAPGSNVLINSVNPGWTRTAMGTSLANRSLAAGAVGIVWAALLPESGPNGGFFSDGKPTHW